MGHNVKDIHDGVREDSALQDTAFYRFIIESLPIGVLTVSPHMKVTSFNPWAEKLTDYSSEEALGRYCGDVLKGGMCTANCPLRRAIDNRRPIVRMETTIQNRSGEILPVRMHTAALMDKGGHLIGAVEAFQDISELKAMEREKDNIISMFAHDMKSSLTIIGGFVLRLLQKGGNMEAGKKNRYLEIVQNETGKLEFMINDFLEFARLQTGKLKMNFQVISLDKLLMELYEAYQSRGMQSGIRFEFLDENTLPVITADPERLRRVLTNLLDNAFKFTKKGGIIILLAEETEEEIKIAIEDSGRGIDPEELPFIFDIFHRGKDSDEIAGTGIGLATVKAIVEGHGGRVSVESKPGKGSIFTVILPKLQRSEGRVLKQSLQGDQPEVPSYGDERV